MRTIAFACLLAAVVASVSCGSSGNKCDCPAVVVGIAFVTAVPVTAVALSGSACQGASFRCVPSNAANTIEANCTHVQIDPKVAGLCVVDATTASMTFHLERQMVVHNYGCCGIVIGETNP